MARVYTSAHAMDLLRGRYEYQSSCSRLAGLHRRLDRWQFDSNRCGFCHSLVIALDERRSFLGAKGCFIFWQGGVIFSGNYWNEI